MDWMKITQTVLITLIISSSAQAHDFWLAPETYSPAVNETFGLSIMMGHPEDQMRWPAAPHRIVALRSVGPNGITDHQASIAENTKSQSIPMKLQEHGLHVITIETTQAVSELRAKKFNAYLEEEGLTPIKIDRVQKGKMDDLGTEVYSRRGKALIQVGDIPDVDPSYLSQPMGLTLEIVPQLHPARIEKGELMSATIYYRGKPTRGVTVGLIDLEGDKGLVEITKSDQSGHIHIPRPEDGTWMLHAVWAAPLPDGNRADYTTVFSSLSFNLDGQ